MIEWIIFNIDTFVVVLSLAMAVGFSSLTCVAGALHSHHYDLRPEHIPLKSWWCHCGVWVIWGVVLISVNHNLSIWLSFGVLMVGSLIVTAIDRLLFGYLTTEFVPYFHQILHKCLFMMVGAPVYYIAMEVWQYYTLF